MREIAQYVMEAIILHRKEQPLSNLLEAGKTVDAPCMIQLKRTFRLVWSKIDDKETAKREIACGLQRYGGYQGVVGLIEMCLEL
jgi:hypothetical protein